MPLHAGNSQQVIGNNIREMVAAGHPQRVAVAASLSNARRHPRNSGGMVPHYDDGGGIGGIAPTAQSMNPMVQGKIQQYSQLPVEKLQELAARTAGSQQGQIIQRILQQKRAMPQPTQAQPMQSAPLGVPLSQQPMMRAGGMIPHRASGGPSFGMENPWWERSEQHGSQSGTGFLHSPVAGRTDHIQVSPPSGSYVIPADVVSGLGEGNSLAGARIIHAAMSSGPWGTQLPHSGGHMGAPRPPAPLKEAKGGGVQNHHTNRVPILAAGGEHILSPEQVSRIGDGDLKRGHQILDKWVVHERKKIIDKMKKLKGPVRQ